MPAFYDGQQDYIDKLNELYEFFEAGPFNSLPITGGTLTGPLTVPTLTVGAGGATGITKTMVGLGNVDNTSDANKPVSTPQQSALDGKLNSNVLGFKNRIDNGAMQIAQRGLSGSTASQPYCLDRWIFTATGAPLVWSRTKTSSANVQDYGFFALSWVGVSGNTGCTLLQRIASYNCADMAGQIVTASFWIYQSTGATINITPALVYSGGADDSWGSQTGIPAILSATPVPSGVWTKVVNRFNIPNAAITGLGFYPWGTAIAFGAGSVGYISKVQLELGTIATSFDVRSYGVELAVCQWYYLSSTYAANTGVALGQAFTTTTAYALISITNPMRVSPSVAITGNLARVGGEVVGAPSAVGISPSGVNFNVARTTTSFVAGDAVMLTAASGGSAIIQLSADL